MFANLVELVEGLVPLLESLHYLHLYLGELNGVHHLLQVLQLGVSVSQQLLEKPLLLQQQFRLPGRGSGGRAGVIV